MFGAQRTTEMNTPENPFCINCQDASYGQFPWQLSLQLDGKSHFCGGALLSPFAFATAAHCKKIGNYKAVAGTIDMNNYGQTKQCDTFIAHPQYDSWRILNDFAVGKVKSGKFFNIDGNTYPIPLIPPSYSRLPDRTALQVSGYGYYIPGMSTISRYLKWSPMEYVDLGRCQSIMSEGSFDNSVLCADYPGVSICSGDSGGPLIYWEPSNGYNRWVLVGIASWAHQNCVHEVNGYPQGFANVQYPDYNYWIKTTAGI